MDSYSRVIVNTFEGDARQMHSPFLCEPNDKLVSGMSVDNCV